MVKITSHAFSELCELYGIDEDMSTAKETEEKNRHALMNDTYSFQTVSDEYESVAKNEMTKKWWK